MGEICPLYYNVIQLNMRTITFVYNLYFKFGRKMSHCDFTTNLKRGEICLLDYHGIQLNVRNLLLCL